MDIGHHGPASTRAITGPILMAASAMGLLGASAGVTAHLADFPLLGGQSLRYAVAAVVLAGIALARGHGLVLPLRPAELARLTALAATGLVAFNICLVEALRRADPATVGSVVGATPLVLALAEPLRNRRRPRGLLVATAALVAAGAALVQGLGQASVGGLLFALGALAGEAAFSLLAVPLLPRLGPLRLSAYITALAAVMLGAAALVRDGTAMLRTPTAAELTALAYLAVPLTVGAFVLWYSALRSLGADRAGLFAGLVPVTAAASQAALGLGRPAAGQIAGAVAVGLGLTLGLRAPHPTSTSPPADDRARGRTDPAPLQEPV
jgi:drug/metabolite transporter (DMT)-like permease